MIYIPNYSETKFSYLGGEIGTVAGAAIGGPVGAAIGNVAGNFIESIFGSKTSAWHKMTADQCAKAVTTLLWEGIWIKGLGYRSSDELYDYVYDSLNAQKVFEGKPVNRESFKQGTADYMNARAYTLRGLNSDGGKPWSQDVYDRFKNFVEKGIFNPPPISRFAPLDKDIMVSQEDQNKIAAATSSNQPAAQTENATAPKSGANKPGTNTPLTPEQKAAKTKNYLIYGGIGLVVVVIIIVVVIILKKKGK